MSGLSYILVFIYREILAKFSHYDHTNNAWAIARYVFHSIVKQRHKLTLSWLSITPFGLPVVPDYVCSGAEVKKEREIEEEGMGKRKDTEVNINTANSRILKRCYTIMLTVLCKHRAICALRASHVAKVYTVNSNSQCR